SQQDDHKIGSMLSPEEGEVEVDEQWWHEWEAREGVEGLPLAEGCIAEEVFCSWSYEFIWRGGHMRRSGHGGAAIEGAQRRRK
ncbi:hypothetical protein B296_00027208, partial [Ensete ventricosum]